jgi:hypothetical protein
MFVFRSATHREQGSPSDPARSCRRGLRAVAVTVIAGIGAAGALVAILPADAAFSGATLFNKRSASCLTVRGGASTAGSPVDIAACTGGVNQRFTSTSTGQIQVAVDGVTHCLDAAGSGTGNGTKIIVWPCHGGTNQSWTHGADNSLRGTASGRCIDIAGSATTAGTGAVLWDCKNGGNGSQAWLPNGTAPPEVSFGDAFDALDQDLWGCEYTCPTVTGGTAAFALDAGIPPNNPGSWSKIRYKGRQFTSGTFTVRFALTARPKQKVWWGAALWDDGPAADGSQFNEINFGYTTNQSFTDSQFFFESAKRGRIVGIKIDAGVDLYTGGYHTAQLEYDANHVSFTFDGRLLHTITDPGVIPTDPMSFVLGPRVVPGSAPLAADFTETIDSTQITW